MKYISHLVDKYYWTVDVCGRGVKLLVVGSMIRFIYGMKIKNLASYIGCPDCFASKPVLPHDVKGIFISN